MKKGDHLLCCTWLLCSAFNTWVQGCLNSCGGRGISAPTTSSMLKNYFYSDTYTYIYIRLLTLIHIRLVYSIHLRIVVSDTYKNHCWKQPTLEIAAEEEASQLRHNPHNPILVALIALIFRYFIVVLSIWLLNSTHLLPAQFYSDTYIHISIL